MGKFYNYFATLCVVMLVFYAFGVLNSGAVSTFMQLILNPNSLSSSDIYVAVFIALSSVIGAVFVGSFRADMVVFAPMLLILVPIGFDIIQLFVVCGSV